MLGPEPACISQSLANAVLLTSGEILDFVVHGIGRKITNILFQFRHHQLQTMDGKGRMMNGRIHEKLGILASLIVCKVVGE
jgi:hypothetical protein